MAERWPQRVSLEWAYREWLLAQAAAESEGGCPRVAPLKSRLAAHFGELTRGWSQEQTSQLMRARIKRAKYYSLPEAQLTPEEEVAASFLEWPILRWSTPGRPQVTVDYPWRPNTQVDVDKKEAALLDVRAASAGFKVSKPLLKKAVRQALKPILGSPFEASGELRYWLPISSVTLETVVGTTPGGLAQWQYWHRLLPEIIDKANQVRLGEELLLRCSITDLLGVHVTEWDCVTDEDVPSQVELLANVVRGFVDAVPAILDSALRRDEASSM